MQKVRTVHLLMADGEVDDVTSEADQWVNRRGFDAVSEAPDLMILENRSDAFEPAGFPYVIVNFEQEPNEALLNLLRTAVQDGERMFVETEENRIKRHARADFAKIVLHQIGLKS